MQTPTPPNLAHPHFLRPSEPVNPAHRLNPLKNPPPKSPTSTLARYACFSLFLILLLTLTPSQAQTQTIPRTLDVAWAVVGVEPLATDSAFAPGFVEALAARPGFTVKSLKPGTGVWGAGQGGAKDGESIALVNVAVGKNRDMLAFVADEKNTTILAALRRQCQVGRKVRRDWVGPGPGQIPENAARELAQDFGHFSAASLKVDPSRRVTITVTPWKTAATDLAGGFVDSAPAAKGSDSAPMEPSSGDGVQAINALAFAALAQAGAQPTSQSVPSTLAIEVARNVDHFALRYTFTQGGKSQQYIQRYISSTELFDHILIASRKLYTWGDFVRSAAKLGDGPAEPLAASKSAVIVGTNGNIRAFEPVSGREPWPALIPKRPGFSYAAIPVGTDTRIIRMNKPAELIDPASGRATPISAESPNYPWAMDISSDNRAAVAVDSSIALYNGSTELWKITLPDPITSGPVLTDRAVFLGTDSGLALALSTADGKEIWRQSTNLRLHGPSALLTDTLLLSSFDGTLLALSPSDGKPLWKHPGKDILLTRPTLASDHFLIADKAGAITLLDPKSGQPKSSFTTPTWLVNATLIQPAGNPLVACTDLHGTLRLLSLPDLKPLREIPLDTDLTKPILLAPDLPTIFAGANEIDQKSPAILVADRKGWLYLINLPDP